MTSVLFEEKDQIATLTMNDPKSRNTLSMEMRIEMTRMLENLEDDPSIRCVIIKGAGDHFMAGGNVKSFAQLLEERSPREIELDFREKFAALIPLIKVMRRLEKPIIASVQGAAAGAGVGLASACDLIIAAENAFFVLAFCHIGVSPDCSTSFYLPRAIGIKKAMEMALLGDRVTAKQAKDLGLVNFVVGDKNLSEETTKLAMRLASGPTGALGQTKRLFYQSLENSLEDQLGLERETFIKTTMKHDFAEGVHAFCEKRRPEFSGH